jgi:hypothetical protein
MPHVGPSQMGAPISVRVAGPFIRKGLSGLLKAKVPQQQNVWFAQTITYGWNTTKFRSSSFNDLRMLDQSAAVPADASGIRLKAPLSFRTIRVCCAIHSPIKKPLSVLPRCRTRQTKLHQEHSHDHNFPKYT